MITFLTSSPTGPLDRSRVVDGMDEKNSFTENLRHYWKENARCLMIAASPEAYEGNQEMTGFFRDAVTKAGLSCTVFDLWDGRTEDTSGEKLHTYDVIFLGGGHVPTQNAFFRKIQLKESIQGFDGVIIGISAGTMNSAEVVYAQPELPGESVDSSYERFLSGLNLTKTMILPHYQMVKDSELDGKRVFEDITYNDSYGKKFLALPDGSYLLIADGTETIWGEAYEISNGRIRRICEENMQKEWKSEE